MDTGEAWKVLHDMSVKLQSHRMSREQKDTADTLRRMSRILRYYETCDAYHSRVAMQELIKAVLGPQGVKDGVE